MAKYTHSHIGTHVYHLAMYIRVARIIQPLPRGKRWPSIMRAMDQTVVYMDLPLPATPTKLAVKKWLTKGSEKGALKR